VVAALSYRKATDDLVNAPFSPIFFDANPFHKMHSVVVMSNSALRIVRHC
jgi:hypothetical protein